MLSASLPESSFLLPGVGPLFDGKPPFPFFWALLLVARLPLLWAPFPDSPSTFLVVRFGLTYRTYASEVCVYAFGTKEQHGLAVNANRTGLSNFLCFVSPSQDCFAPRGVLLRSL